MVDIEGMKFSFMYTNMLSQSIQCGIPRGSYQYHAGCTSYGTAPMLHCFWEHCFYLLWDLYIASSYASTSPLLQTLHR